MPELRDGRVYVGGVAASDLAALHGTPLYVLDARPIDTNLARMRDAFSHSAPSIYYSCKANPSVGLLRRLRSAGVRLDACSPGDLAFAAAAGFAGDEISYTGHSMTDDELRAVATSGASFTADSREQVERFGRIASGRAIGLRLNCAIEAGFHPHVRAGGFSSKFGIHREQLADALDSARGHGLRVVGLHGHLGSDLTHHAPHVELLDALLAAGAEVPDLAWVNLGGGWGDLDDERYDFATFGREVDARLAAAGRPLELRLEPGGFLVIDAGCLLTRVTELKPSVEVDGRSSPTFVGTDTSHNHLVSSVIYGAQHPIWIADRADEPPAGRFDVVGNLMQAGDVIARERELPQPRPGDVLAIGRCGGYAAWRAPNFNERPRPAEVLVERGTARLLRRAETTEDLLALEAL